MWRLLRLAVALPALLTLSLALLAPAGKANDPKEEPVDPVMVRLRAQLTPTFPNWSPEYVVERCAEHIATINQYDRIYIRYLDLSDVTWDLLPVATASLFFGTSSAARVTVTTVPQAVPDTDNRIYWLDLRWFNWTPQTWESICGEDPYFREPIIPSSSVGLRFLKEQTLANAVMRWDWLCFYAYDNSQFLQLNQTFNEKAFYYQLVYSNVEFVRETKKDGKATKTKVRGVGPKNIREFWSAWRVNFDILKDFPIDQGFMIDTAHSGVSWENRIGWRVRTAIGVYWRTFDVERTAGDQDFVETPFPKHFDAGEHIVTDNRGCQFYHLSNGADESIDFADPRVVNDKVSGLRVLATAGACIHCHDNGIIGFKNAHRRLLEIGARLQAVDANRASRFTQFYLQDSKLAKYVKDDQRDYAEFVKDCNGLMPNENASQFGRFRRWYAQGVDLQQAAREIGAEPQELSDAIGFQGTKGRLGALVLDNTPIPRYVWERGLFAESALLLQKWRKDMKMNPRGKTPSPKR